MHTFKQKIETQSLFDLPMEQRIGKEQELR